MPRLASWRAISNPIPLFAPVTSAMRSAMLPMTGPPPAAVAISGVEVAGVAVGILHAPWFYRSWCAGRWTVDRLHRCGMLTRREWEAQPMALCDADELARIGILR